MKFVPLILVLTLLAVPSPSEARGRGDGPGFHGMFRKLDLTEEQRKTLKSMKGEDREKMKSLREKKRDLEKKLQQALASDASESSLKSLHNQVMDSKQQLDNLRFERILKVRKVLTPEQRKKFAEMHKGRKRHHRRGKNGN